jgi:mRNA interferase MazF
MTRLDPLRAEVWDVRFPSFGQHPAVILSINQLNTRLGHVAVVPITGTRGPALTHIPLGIDAGVTRYDQFYADITTVQSVAKSRCQNRRGLLAPSEMERLEEQLRVYLGL